MRRIDLYVLTHLANNNNVNYAIQFRITQGVHAHKTQSLKMQRNADIVDKC